MCVYVNTVVWFVCGLLCDAGLSVCLLRLCVLVCGYAFVRFVCGLLCDVVWFVLGVCCCACARVCVFAFSVCVRLFVVCCVLLCGLLAFVRVWFVCACVL